MVVKRKSRSIRRRKSRSIRKSSVRRLRKTLKRSVKRKTHRKRPIKSKYQHVVEEIPIKSKYQHVVEEHGNYRNALEKHNVRHSKEINDEIYTKFKFNFQTEAGYTEQIVRFLLQNVPRYCIQRIRMDIRSSREPIIDMPNRTQCDDYEVFHLWIILSTSSHSNVLLIDHIKRTFERFEPNGEFDEIDEKVNTTLDTTIRYYLQLNGYTYIRPEQFCPIVNNIYNGPQRFVASTNLDGTCTMWSVWYVHQRLMYPNKTRSEIISQITRNNAYTIIQEFIYYLASQSELLFGGKFLN